MGSGAAVKVAVLGAGGTIAPAIVRDLADSPEVSRLQLLDLDEERAAAVAQAHGGGKASASAVDARDTGALAAAVGEADVLLNTASYRVNLHAMRGALEAGCHYLDLGGLYWMTARQLVLSGDFERAGLLAVLGIGSSPGKTNLMARHVVHQFGDEVESIEIVAAGRDPAAPADGRLRPPYAIQTLLDELTLQPVVLRDGQAIEIEPLSSGGTVDVGEPIGRVQTIYTLHSELATFADSFGCRQASFRLSLAPPALDALTELAGATVETVNAAARQAASPSNETISVQVVIVRTSGGRTATMRAVTRPHFGLGGSIVSTAAPAAATVRLFARGSLRSAGAHPPERCIDPEEMFAELRERGCTFSME